MGTIRSEREVNTIAGFPAGMDNTSPATALPTNEFGIETAVRDARNVDFTKEGKPSRRAGRVRLEAGDFHSVFADPEFPYLLRRHGDALEALDPALQADVIATGLGSDYASYCVLNGELLWTVEGRACGRVDTLLNNRPLALPTPLGVTASAGSGGGLAPGAYLVALTYLDDTGEESGACPAVAVDVGADGHLELTLPPAPAGVGMTRVYVSEPSGRTLFADHDLPAFLTSTTVTAGVRGAELLTQSLQPLPAGQIVRESNGIVLMAAGRVLWFGRAMRPRLHHPAQDFVPFPARIDLLEPLGEAEAAGTYVGAGKRVFWLGGATPKQSSMRMARLVGVQPGSACQLPGSWVGEAAPRVAYWVGLDGVPCIGLPGGQVRPLNARVVVNALERAATLVREQHGLRQILTAGPKGAVGAAAVADSVEVFQYRNGIPVP